MDQEEASFVKTCLLNNLISLNVSYPYTLLHLNNTHSNHTGIRLYLTCTSRSNIMLNLTKSSQISPETVNIHVVFIIDCSSLLNRCSPQCENPTQNPPIVEIENGFYVHN